MDEKRERKREREKEGREFEKVEGVGKTVQEAGRSGVVDASISTLC